MQFIHQLPQAEAGRPCAGGEWWQGLGLHVRSWLVELRSRLLHSLALRNGSFMSSRENTFLWTSRPLNSKITVETWWEKIEKVRELRPWKGWKDVCLEFIHEFIAELGRQHGPRPTPAWPSVGLSVEQKGRVGRDPF